MKISNVLILLGAVVAGLFLVPQWIVVAPHIKEQQAYTVEKLLAPNADKIRSAVAESLRRPDPACLQTVHFPYDSSRAYGPCDMCEALVDAGLLTRSVTASEDGRKIVAVRFELTPLGRPLYTTSLQDGHRDEIPGFCFGRTVLHRVDLKAPPRVVSDPVIEVRYVARIENPHPVLYEPSARALRLPELKRSQHELPPQRTCAWLDSKGAFEELSPCAYEVVWP